MRRGWGCEKSPPSTINKKGQDYYEYFIENKMVYY
ncbi:hypothetical protein LCGC14_2901340, partial [marine sediment metagenome]